MKLNQKGITIIEMMFALAIFMITFAIAGTSHFQASKLNRAGNMSTQANMFAREKVEELWNVRAWKLEDGIFEDQSDNGVYIRTWELVEYASKSKTLKVTVTWHAPLDKRRSVTIETLIRGPLPKVHHF